MRSEQISRRDVKKRVVLREMTACRQPFFRKWEYGSTKFCKIRYVVIK